MATCARVNLTTAKVTRGLDRFGRSEVFFGMSVKPRRVDFDLFHQSAEAENCYGPFRNADLSDELNEKGLFGWAGPDRLIYEGWFDTSRIHRQAGTADRATSSSGSTSTSGSVIFLVSDSPIT